MKKLLFVSAVVCLVMACEKPSNEIPGPGPGDGSDTTEVPDPAAPVLTLTSEAAVSVGPDGGPVTVTYTLENPAEDGEISASASDGADWCADFDCETEGTVTFTVAPNGGAAREAVVTVAYTYGGGEAETVQVTVSQEGNVIDFNASYAYGVYFGDDVSGKDGDMVYQICFSDVPESGNRVPDATYYVISVVSGEPASMNAIAPADGTYFLQEGEDTQIGTVWGNENYTYGRTTGPDEGADIVYQFVSGEITFTRDGNAMIVEGEFMDSDDVVHTLSYRGSILLSDGRRPDIPEDALTTLTGDVIDFNTGWTATAAEGYFFGSRNFTEVKEYTMTIKDASYSDYRTVMLTVYAPLSNTVEDGIPDGVYPVSSTVAENTVRAGYLNEGSTVLQASWLYDRSYSYPDTEAGPLYDGAVTFERNEDGSYNVLIDAEDDAGHVIRAAFSNIFYSPYSME